MDLAAETCSSGQHTQRKSKSAPDTSVRVVFLTPMAALLADKIILTWHSRKSTDVVDLEMSLLRPGH